MASLKEIAWRTGLTITIATGSVGVPAIIEQQKGGSPFSTQALNELLSSSGLALNIPSLKSAEASAPLISPDRPLTREVLTEELLTLLQGARKYTLNDGSWRIQYPGEEVSEIGWSRFAEGLGQAIGAGVVKEAEYTDLFIRGVHEDIRRFNVLPDKINSTINASFALRGLYSGRSVLLPKLKEYRVNEAGQITPDGSRTLEDYWVNSLSALLSDGDFKGNHASFRLVAKTVLSSLFPGAPQLSSWVENDIAAIRDSDHGGGVFIDLKNGTSNIDLYTVAIQENLQFLHRYFQKDLEQTGKRGYSEEELRSRANFYLNHWINMITKEGVAIHWGRSAFTTSANPPIIISQLGMSKEYGVTSYVPVLKNLFKQSLLNLNRESDYILPRLTREASAGDVYINSVVASSNVASALGRSLFDIPPDVWDLPDGDITRYPGTAFWSEGGILRHTTPEGVPLVVTAASLSGDKTTFAKLQHPDFRQEGYEAWLGDRPVVYGLPMLRYKEGAFGNLSFLVGANQDSYNMGGFMDMDDVGWVSYKGNLTEFADRLGRSGRVTDNYQRSFKILWQGREFNIHKFIAGDGKSIEGINESSLPLPIDEGVSPQVEQVGDSIKLSFADRSIFGRLLYGGDIIRPYIFGEPKDQRNAYRKSNYSIIFGSRGDGRKEMILVTEFVYRKGAGADLLKERDFAKVLQVDTNRVVLELGGKRVFVDFGGMYAGGEIVLTDFFTNERR